MLNVRFLRQYSVENFILDFYCPLIRLAIELDGGQHAEHQQYDTERTTRLQSHDITVLRFWNNDVINNLNGVLETIYKKVLEARNPS